MNYKIIQNEIALREFIDWLPEISNQERLYCSLLARNKYLEDKKAMGTDKIGLKSFLSSKKDLFNKIWQLEVPFGAYVCNKTMQPVPQEALVVYVTYNPRDIVEATFDTIDLLNKKVRRAFDGYNPKSITLTAFQTSIPKSANFFDFDFDFCSLEEKREELESCVNKDALSYIITRGGFHALVNLKKMESKYEKSYVSKIAKIKGCDVKNNTKGMIPVPGTVQSNFCPKLIK